MINIFITALILILIFEFIIQFLVNIIKDDFQLLITQDDEFPEFKKKIVYIPVENEPEGVVYQEKNNVFFEENIDMRMNSIKRIAHQRDKLMECLSEASDEDYIFYSDNDEIPNFENFNFESNQFKIQYQLHYSIHSVKTIIKKMAFFLKIFTLK